MTSVPNKSPTSPTQPADTDPLLTLDFSTALFPLGPADPLDPSSFHDLLTHATSLLSTFQAAYRSQSTTLRDLRAEHAVQIDEREEAETRARHLKMQLDDMSGRLAATGAECEALRHEQRQRQDVDSRWEQHVGKDLEAGSNSADSDSGFESESESNGKESPVLGAYDTERWDARRDSWKGSGALNAVSAPIATDLRSENQALRMRVAELELAVDSCLNLIR
jgi:hypothetical protein